jgi:hypothetical protein
MTITTTRPIPRLLLILVIMALAVIGYLAGASSGAPPVGEAIEVHGDWTIEVVEADGTIVAVHEFTNDLVPEGARRLARVLSGESRAFGIHAHEVTEENLGLYCSDGAQALFGFCWASTTRTCPPEGYEEVDGNCVRVGNPNHVIAPDGTLTVTREVAARDDPWFIHGVSSAYFSTVAFDPDELWYHELTRAVLDQPVPVDAGQRARLTVVISFS